MQDHTIKGPSRKLKCVLTKGSDTKWNIFIERRVKSEDRIFADGTIVPKNHFALEEPLHHIGEIFHLRSGDFGHSISVKHRSNTPADSETKASLGEAVHGGRVGSSN